MISIQTAGTEILSGNPRPFYIFVGSEYGIKLEYLEILSQYYKNKVVSVDSADSVIKMMSQKHMIPLEPTLYVARYDEQFVSLADQAYAQKVAKAHIIGTLVCIYEQPKHATKLDKLFPDNTVSMDPLSDGLKVKYLTRAFPRVPSHIIDAVVKNTASYGHARLVCASLNDADSKEIFQLSSNDIEAAVGVESRCSETAMKRGIASRNFKYLTSLLDSCTDYDAFLYAFLSTCIEIDKCLSSKYATSDVSEFVKRWNRSDMYNMFCHAYDEILKTRTDSIDLEDSLIYLFSLLQFNPIPPKGVLDGV